MPKLGQKTVIIDPEQLAAFMRMKPSLADTAAFFKCGETSIAEYIRANFNLTFREFRDQNMVHTRHDLIRTALSKAKQGDNIMLIFCLKNLCGWSDKPEKEQDDTDKYKTMSTAELLKLVKEKTA